MAGRKKSVRKAAPRSKTAAAPPRRGRKTRKPARRSAARAVRSTIAPQTNLSDLLARLVVRPKVEFRVPVRRPDDLVVFDLVFENLKLVPGTPATLVRDNPQKPSYFVVEFPPQSFGEEAYLDPAGKEGVGNDQAPFPNTSDAAPDKSNDFTPGPPLPPMPAARIRMAGTSRLAFSMPDAVQDLGYDLASVLAACRTWPQRRDVLAAPEPRFVARPGAQSGKAWLKTITSSQHWLATSSILFGALEEAGPREMVRATASAATRVGEHAATALAANRTANLSTELERLVLGEAAALARQYPGLREGRLRDVMMAALAVRATESLASSALAFGDDESFIVAVPFLPIVLSPHPPGADVTALELPYRLCISPIEAARWLHSDRPRTSTRTGRTELWHTRLTTAPDDFGPDHRSKIRAIWSPDYPLDVLPYLGPPPLPFRMSLDPLDRQMLVKLMAGYDEKTSLSPPKPFTPRPGIAQRLHLSALGGLLDAEGVWTSRPETIVKEDPLQTEVIGLEQWRHLATLGRDHYVKVVYAGYLLPFGHHASFIKVTERKFEPLDTAQPTEKRVAALRQRFFIVVREHVKTYPGAGTGAGWFDFPFPQVEILTKVTPSLIAPDNAACFVKEVAGAIYTLVPHRAAFWPMLASNKTTGNFVFEIAVTDLCGNRTTFAMPLLFIGDEANTGKVDGDSIAARVVAGYNDEDESPRRTGPTGGVTICFAPDDATNEGGTGLPTESLVFCAEPATGGLTEPISRLPCARGTSASRRSSACSG